MPEHDYEESKWVDHLGAALDALAENASQYVVRDSSGVRHLLSFDQCRALAQHAEHGTDTRDAFNTLHVKLNCFPAEAMAIFLTHPVICRALPDCSEDGEIQYIMLDNWGGFQLSELVSMSMKAVIETGGRTAASMLNRFLTLGEMRKLRAYEITVFDEVEINSRVDMGQREFLTRYDDAKVSYSLPAYKEATSRSLRGSQATPAVVFVREFSWGIAVGPLPKNRDPIVEPEYPFSVSHENIIDLLSIATGKPLTAPLQYIQISREMHSIGIMIAKQSTAGSRRGARHLLSDQDIETFRKLMCGWQTCNQRRDAVELAIARLADSFSRTGRFELEDRILDTSTALEIMYELEGSELRYKLATRAARFLGSSDEESRSILNLLKSFYNHRSAIVHNGKAKQSRTRIATDLSEVSDLARRTLFKLLVDGQPGDWDELVVSGGNLQSDS